MTFHKREVCIGLRWQQPRRADRTPSELAKFLAPARTRSAHPGSQIMHRRDHCAIRMAVGLTSHAVTKSRHLYGPQPQHPPIWSNDGTGENARKRGVNGPWRPRAILLKTHGRPENDVNALGGRSGSAYTPAWVRTLPVWAKLVRMSDCAMNGGRRAPPSPIGKR